MRGASCAIGAAIMALTVSATAQTPRDVTPSPPPAVDDATRPGEPGAVPPETKARPEPTARPAQAVQGAVTSPRVTAASATATPQADGPAWYDVIDAEAFVDGYVSINSNFPQPQTDANTFRAFDMHNGVALHWVGLNASVAPDPVGVTLHLRFGPGTTPFSGLDAGTPMESVKQAFGTLRPGGDGGRIAVDFGKFDTPYGAELVDSQLNINYTRGLLNWLMQPYFHAGFRVEAAPVDELVIKAILVNGANNTLDNNAGKSGGVQLMLKPSPVFAAYVGYFVGPEQPETSTITCLPGTQLQGEVCVAAANAPGGDGEVLDGDANERLRHLVDVVLDINPTDELRFLVNGDLGTERLPDGTHPIWVGGSLATNLQFTSAFGLGLRGEILSDAEGYITGAPGEATLGSGTLTAHLTPWAYFATYIEERVDGGSEDFFRKRFDQVASYQATTTLGIIVKSR